MKSDDNSINDPKPFLVKRLAIDNLIALLWIIDYLLKILLGLSIVFFVWVPTYFIFEVKFTMRWGIAGFIVGSCFVGMWEGCDIFLGRRMKRLAEQQRVIQQIDECWALA